MSGGSPGDEPRPGGTRGGYGPDPRYQPPGPVARDEPDEDGPGHGSADLSDLWHEPGPLAPGARRGFEAGPDRGQPGYSGRPQPDDRNAYPADRDRGGQPSYLTEPGRGAGRSYAPRENEGGGGQGDDPWRPGPAGPGAPWDEQTYQSPVTWSGGDQGPAQARRAPDAPTEVQRDPNGWYESPERPHDRGRSPHTGGQPGSPDAQDAWRQAPPPAGPPRRPAAPPPGPADPGQGERAWWDDAFRSSPSADTGRRGSAGPGRALPPGQPERPSRPAPPRRPSAQGYGVPPGDLTQPIPIYQPQGTFVADAYQRVAGPFPEDSLEETAYIPQPVFRPEAAAGTGLARSTGSMAMGTLISRVTGFLRTFVLVFALGTATLANAYNNANTLPNAVYDVMIGGVLTSVVVPLLVKAAGAHRDGGEAYNQRIFTLTVAALGIVTVVATIAAGLLVELYAASVHGTEHRLMVVFAYFFIPQIFFYGLSSLMGAIPNTRNSFAAPMWTPIINNVVVIVVGLLFVVTIGLDKSATTVSSGGVLLLGIGTTLGIIVQTIALVPALRKVGFRWRPRFDFRREELAEIGRMAIWMLGYVVSTQITFIVTTRLANAASVHVPDAGVSAYNYSYALFLLPYAIIGVSVTTALLPRMSRYAAEGKFWLVRDDFSASIRLSSVVLVPAALLLAALGPALCEFLFSYGSSSVADARYIGEAFAAFSLGLVPFVIFQLLLRVFYALHDSRTPAIVGFLTMIATVVGNLIVAAILPPGQVVVGMAFVYGISYVLSAAIAWRLLNRRVGSLDGRVVTRSLIRMHVATIPPLILALAVSAAVGTVVHPGAVYGFIAVLVGGGGALLLYIIVARALRLDELSQLMRMVGGRFGRRA